MIFTDVGTQPATVVPGAETVTPGKFVGWFVVAFGFGFGTYTFKSLFAGRFTSYLHQLITVHVRSIL